MNAHFIGARTMHARLIGARTMHAHFICARTITELLDVFFVYSTIFDRYELLFTRHKFYCSSLKV